MAKERWITVKGNHILIKDGQSVADAIKENFGEGSKRGRKRINGGKYEYSMDEGKTWEDLDSDSYNEMDADDDEFDGESDEDFNAGENEKLQNKELDGVDKEDNLNPNNPKYEGFSRSSITNAKEVDEGYEFTDANGNKVRYSIIEYIPYGALQDGDNRKLYGVVKNYDGSDAPDIGAMVSGSLERAKEDLESQVKLGIQGPDRYLRRGKYDEEYFNLIRDNREEGDDEKYKERYGWDFNKPFNEHDFMKDDPYEKWKSERETSSSKNTDIVDDIVDMYYEEDFLQDGLTDEDREEIENEVGKIDDEEWSSIRDMANERGKAKAIKKIANSSEPQPLLGTPDNWPDMTVEEREKWLNDTYNKKSK